MGRIAFLVVGLICVLLLVFLGGPRVRMETETTAVRLPDDLDAYLAERESKVVLTRSDVAKKILWADPERKEKTEVSLVYLHGFSATRMETYPLTRSIAEKLGANVFYTRLSGHGQSREYFAEATANEWLHDTLEAWEIGRRIGKRVVIIGCSTGATLATWLAVTQPVDELAALVHISPNFMPANPAASILFQPWGLQVAGLITGSPYRSWEPANEGHARYWMTTPALKTSAESVVLVNYVNSLDLESLQIPVLVLYSERDTVVSIPMIKENFERFGSPGKKLVQVNNEGNGSNHVLAGEIVGQNSHAFVQAQIEGFLASLDIK